MSQKDRSSSSRVSSGKGDPEPTKRARVGDDLYSAIDNDFNDKTEPGAEEDEDWKSKVLATYKRRPTDTHTLLAKIQDGKATFEVGERHKTVSLQEAMITVVERMFDAFQNYGYDFNKEATGSELELNWIRPVLGKEGSLSVFSGRLSTRRWTMIIKGLPQEVLAFILPTDKLIGFSLSTTEFKPYIKMQPCSDGLDVRWKVDKTVIAPEYFSRLFQQMFVALIKHAQNDGGGGDTFDVRKLSALNVEEEQEEDMHQKYRDAFFEDMRERAGSGAPSAPPRNSAAQQPQAPLPPPAPQQAAASEEPQPPQPPQQPQPQAPQQPAAEAQPERPAGPGQQFAQLQRQMNNMNQVRQGDAGADPSQLPPNAMPPDNQHGQQMSPGQALPNQPPVSFANSLYLMLGALDRELEIVAKAGSDAFAQKDLARADAALKFSERLTEFRKNAQHLMDYYRRR